MLVKHQCLALGFGLFSCLPLAWAETNTASTRQTATAYAEKTLNATRERFQSSPTNAEAAWKFARACFDRAEYPSNDTHRATLAVEGMGAARSVLRSTDFSAPAHYYLAMNMGQMARTKLFGALKIVSEMEPEFKRAIELDERFDHAGPDRNLGQLYFQAPGWPASIGNRTKARRHFERAVALAPDYPPNRLFLVEALLKWGENKEAERHWIELDRNWSNARKVFAEETGTHMWNKWEQEFKDYGRKLGKTPGSGKSEQSRP